MNHLGGNKRTYSQRIGGTIAKPHKPTLEPCFAKEPPANAPRNCKMNRQQYDRIKSHTATPVTVAQLPLNSKKAHYVTSIHAILLLDFTNDARSRGSNLYDAVMEAGKQRLRPILMTTLSMVIGMLPIAIAAGAGSEW